MYPDFYDKVSAPWRKRAGGQEALVRADVVLRAGFAALYVALIAWLAATGDAHLLRAVMVPALTFAFVTVLRMMINADRPWEAYPITPIIFKDVHGRSMPSRHMASATSIAFALLWVNPLWGAVGLLGATTVGYVRIAGGVHFPRDIAIAAGIAALFALLGYVLIP